MAYGRLHGMFEAAGWQVLTVKYGRRLQALFEQPGGSALRRRIDTMTNEEYQRLIRLDAAALRERLPGEGQGRRELARLAQTLDDHYLREAVRGLGGHDLGALLDAYREADAAADRPTVIFAYTIKGWSLPIEGHPSNHSTLLTAEQLDELAPQLGSDALDPWATFTAGTAEAELCAAAAARLERPVRPYREPPAAPSDLGRRHQGHASTQQALGRLFSDLAREAPQLAKRIVTVSPDVASSTNLAGWIGKVGVWNPQERVDWFADDPERLTPWHEDTHGRHVELGIAETNLVGLLSELGATFSRWGEPLLPVGTLYDPFVTRALEPWSFGIYAGGQSILVGTPSGITLAPEGGAHQSIVTPSIGIEQPGCIAYEPAFGQDLEWTFLYALSRLARPDGSSAYFRLSTRPLDQALAAIPDKGQARETRRRQAVAGGYRLRDLNDGEPRGVTIAALGALVPEALAAAEVLAGGGLGVDVLCLTSPDLVFRALQARKGLQEGETWILDELFPAARTRPVLGVVDGHPHALAFLGAVHGVASTCLGVSTFGQSGGLDDLYRTYGIDAEAIVGAALDLA